MCKNFKVLVVDDETEQVELVKCTLEMEGFVVLQTNNGHAAVDLAREIIPHLILLDVMLPDIDGIEVCSLLREIPELKNTMIAFLTARSEDYSQIAGFAAGADDYIIKPVRPKVLKKRIFALLKRFEPKLFESVSLTTQEPSQKQHGNVTINYERYAVIIDDKEIYLRKKEFVLLKLLASKPSKLFTREEIFYTLWSDDDFVNDRVIDVYVRKLREKIGEDKIKTIKGVGYKLG